MAFESVRSYVQLASGLGEMTKAKAMEAAQGLLALARGRRGHPTAPCRRRPSPTSCSRLPVRTGPTCSPSIQGEVESALKKADVARVADVRCRPRRPRRLVTKEIADLRAMLVATGASAVAGASRSPTRLGPSARREP